MDIEAKRKDSRERSRRYYVKNKTKKSLARKLYLKTDAGKETQRKASSKWSSKKRREDPNFKLRLLIRNRMKNAIKSGKKAGSAIKDLGCTLSEYRSYIESKFKPGMTWENHGNGSGKWNIDHILPLSMFDLTNREQFLKACNYLNTQPLWFTENLSKSDKIELKQSY